MQSPRVDFISKQGQTTDINLKTKGLTLRKIFRKGIQKVLGELFRSENDPMAAKLGLSYLNLDQNYAFLAGNSSKSVAESNQGHTLYVGKAALRKPVVSEKQSELNLTRVAHTGQAAFSSASVTEKSSDNIPVS